MLIEAFLATSLLVSHPSEIEILSDDRATACFVSLMSQSGWGRRSDERAAFLVRGEDGVQCVEWPAQWRSQAASYKGIIPDGTVAIVHTHPLSVPDPSSHDIIEAERLGLPIIVLTPNALSITHRGKVSRVASRFGWFEQRR